MTIKEGIIVAEEGLKKKILADSIGMKDYTFLSYGAVLEGLFGSVRKPAVFLLMKEYGLSYDEALEYMKYIPFVEEKTYGAIKLDSMVSAKSFLRKNSMLEQDKYFPFNLRNKTITLTERKDTEQYRYILSLLKEYTQVEELEAATLEYTPVVHSYASIEDEVYGICNEIKTLHAKGVSYNRMVIVNASSDYLFLFRRMLETYQIPFDMNHKGSILHTPYARKLLTLMEEKSSFQEILDELKDNSYQAELFNIILSYELGDKNPKDYIPFIKRKLKSFTLPKVTYTEMVSFGDYRDYSTDEYVFFCGLNLGEAPRVYKDEAYLRDAELAMLHLPTSVEKNRVERQKVISLLKTTKNLYASFARGKGTKEIEPSAILSLLDLDIIEEKPEYGYSSSEDSLRFAKQISIYDKIHEMDEALGIYSMKNISYKSYDNTFKGIDKDNMKTRFTEEKPLSLSYSVVKTYFECPFAFYANRILGLDTFDSSTATRLGTYSHAVLQDSYDSDFDFEKSTHSRKVEVLLETDPEEYAKDEFYFEQMKSVLSEILEFNREHEKNTIFTDVEREAHVEYIHGNMKFHGFIDKLMYAEIGGEIYAAIIDYKTGKDRVDLKNVTDGFHLQLPSYMYLLSKYPKFTGKKIHILGIYLQKVNMVMLDNTQDLVKQREKSFALQGYTIKDQSLLPYIDPDYSKSTYISGMRTTKDGSFYKGVKVITEEEENELISIVDEKIHEAYSGVMEGKFTVAPKRINGADKSCTFCKYKDICYKTPKDYVSLEEKKFPKEEE